MMKPSYANALKEAAPDAGLAQDKSSNASDKPGKIVFIRPSCRPKPKDPYEACHKVLRLPELCLMILHALELEGPGYWDVMRCAEAGTPFIDVIRGDPRLSVRHGLEYPEKKSDRRFTHNSEIFFWDLSCRRLMSNGRYCRSKHLYEVSPLVWSSGRTLPEMQIDYGCDDEEGDPIGIYMTGYEDIVKALQSRDLFLQMKIGNALVEFKLHISDGHYRNRRTYDWQGPPMVLKWKTAQITLRCGEVESMLRIAKKLHECADGIDKMLREGELTEWDEEAGIVPNSPWKAFFSPKELAMIVSEQPTYRWAWPKGSWGNSFSEGVSFAQHNRAWEKEREDREARERWYAEMGL